MIDPDKLNDDEFIAAVKKVADQLLEAPSGTPSNEMDNANWADKPHRVLYDALQLTDQVLIRL